MPDNKIRENRLRRMAERQHLRLCKSPRRDRYAGDYGRYHVVDDRNVVVLGATNYEFDATLDQVEAFLTRRKPAPAGR